MIGNLKNICQPYVNKIISFYNSHLKNTFESYLKKIISFYKNHIKSIQWNKVTLTSSLQNGRNFVSSRKALAFSIIGGGGAFIGSLIGYQLGGGQSASLTGGLFHVGAWDACVAVGIGLAIAWMQACYMRRSEVGRKEIFRIAGRCALGGAAGGAALVLMKSNFGGQTLGHILGWTAEGLIMGWILAPVFPNLKQRPAVFGGALAGGLGAVLGLIITPMVGVAFGIACADALKGVFLGAMLTFTERMQLFSEASIIVHWAKNETSTLLLGKEPIRLGGDPSCHIYLKKDGGGIIPLVAEISLSGGKIIFEDKRNGLKTELIDRTKVNIANIVVEVKAAKIH